MNSRKPSRPKKHTPKRSSYRMVFIDQVRLREAAAFFYKLGERKPEVKS